MHESRSKRAGSTLGYAKLYGGFLMNSGTGRTVSKYRLASLAAVTCPRRRVLFGNRRATSRDTDYLDFSFANRCQQAPAPTPMTGPLEKDWKSYGGTAYFGCPDKFSVGNKALDEIRPKIFDTETGQYVAPAIPTPPAGENVTGAMCALTGSADDMRVVYVVTTATKTTAYSYDVKSGRPPATKELVPPTSDLNLTAATPPNPGHITRVHETRDGSLASHKPNVNAADRNELSRL